MRLPSLVKILYGQFQSVYKPGFICETALVKYISIFYQLDSKSNVVLFLQDLTAAFDTVTMIFYSLNCLKILVLVTMC